jgi:hypothetical protein
MVSGMGEADRIVGRKIQNRTAIPFPGSQDETPVPGSRLLAEYVRGMKQFEADREKQREAERNATPPPATLVDALRQALEPHQQREETPALNDSRLLTALGSADGSKSAREAIAKILHDHREQNP